jgi:large subunit ribosomal protein L14e
MLETGRICIKTTGKEAGKKAIILKTEKGQPIIQGPHIKKRKCNPKHLIITDKKINIKENPTQKEINEKLAKV